MAFYAFVDGALLHSIIEITDPEAPVPPGYVQVSEGEAPLMLEGLAFWRYAADTGTFTFDLQTYKEWSISQVDELFGKIRRRYLTTTPGQTETYMEKAQDAERYIADGYPADASTYPYVSGEARAMFGLTPTSMDFANAADYIVATKTQWKALGAMLEEARVTAKRAVGSAATRDDVVLALQNMYSAIDGV